jgi:predicted Zn-dependent protease
MNIKFLSTIIFFILILSTKPGFSQDKLAEILQEEIQREFNVLNKQEIPAYYLSYRVEETNSCNLSASFGALTESHETKLRKLTVTMRVGSPDLDNFHSLRGSPSMGMFFSLNEIPLSEEPLAIKQILWNATNDAYQQAVAQFSRVKSTLTLKVEEEDKSPDFILSQGNIYFEPPINQSDYGFDSRGWEDRIKKYSAVFLKDSSIFSGTAQMSFQLQRKYFVSSSGDKIVQNAPSATVNFIGQIKAKDGMVMPLYQSYFSKKPNDLPADAEMTKDVENLIKNLTALKNAPVAEPYSGPALLSSKAAGVFFHEIFGHRVEGQRLKLEEDAQTFKNKINEQVLPVSLSVICDPLSTKYENIELNGSYAYDDQGTKAQRVDIVKDGILSGFLMSRTPVKSFFQSNGHGRAMSGMQPTSRQSNLIVQTSTPKTNDELREELVNLAKAQNKPYAYFFDQVQGGFTMTGRMMPNAFNITPLMVYRIYTDGRPDELVRGVDLVGTPLAIFSQIDQMGGKTEVFNGNCGAESGTIPVACVSPMMVIKIIETQRKAKSQDRDFILSRP